MKSYALIAALCLPVFLVTAGWHNGQEDSSSQIERSYDRFKDETSVKLKPQPIKQVARPREELSLSAEAIFKGEQLLCPKQVDLLFDSVAERYVYHREAEVIFIIDGERLDAGTAYSMSVLPSPNLIKETLKLTIPFDKFSRVINGKDIEMQFGPTELKLAEKELAPLRAFASYMKCQ